jgi:hypothetical protein
MFDPQGLRSTVGEQGAGERPTRVHPSLASLVTTARHPVDPPLHPPCLKKGPTAYDHNHLLRPYQVTHHQPLSSNMKFSAALLLLACLCFTATVLASDDLDKRGDGCVTIILTLSTAQRHLTMLFVHQNRRGAPDRSGCSCCPNGAFGPTFSPTCRLSSHHPPKLCRCPRSRLL